MRPFEELDSTPVREADVCPDERDLLKLVCKILKCGKPGPGRPWSSVYGQWAAFVVLAADMHLTLRRRSTHVSSHLSRAGTSRQFLVMSALAPVAINGTVRARPIVLMLQAHPPFRTDANQQRCDWTDGRDAGE